MLINRTIQYNRIQCLHCLDVIMSTDDIYNLVWCKCGLVAVGGGVEFLERRGELDLDYQELTTWWDK